MKVSVSRENNGDMSHGFGRSFTLLKTVITPSFLTLHLFFKVVVHRKFFALTFLFVQRLQRQGTPLHLILLEGDYFE